MKKINQKDYQFYVVNPKTRKILTGWQYKNDAQDFVNEQNSSTLKVYTFNYVKRNLKLDPNDNKSWGEELGNVKYSGGKEMVLYGDFDKAIHVPEIKIRYNKGKFIHPISSSDNVRTLLMKIFGRSVGLQEQFVMLLLDNSNKVFGYYKHTIGTPTASMVDIPMLMAVALKSLARSIILSHNHPSGNTRPSDADRSLTKAIETAAKSNGFKVLDHVIITPSADYFSFADEGQLSGLGFGKHPKSKSEDTLELRLRQEIFLQLKKVNSNKTLTPKVFELIQTPKGYAWMEQRIIQMMLFDSIGVSACIPQIEIELP